MSGVAGELRTADLRKVTKLRHALSHVRIDTQCVYIHVYLYTCIHIHTCIPQLLFGKVSVPRSKLCALAPGSLTAFMMRVLALRLGFLHIVHPKLQRPAGLYWILGLRFEIWVGVSKSLRVKQFWHADRTCH